jgi:hypothetical protein
MSIFKGQRPDITPAQVVATLVAGIPVVSNLLASFNVYHVSAVQQQALSDSVTWGGVVAGLLIGGDVAIRAARNHADAKVTAATVAAAADGSESSPVDDPADDEGGVPIAELPSDEEEAAAPPPDPDEPDDPPVVQSSQR